MKGYNLVKDNISVIMEVLNMQVKFKGDIVNLAGNKVEVGTTARDFKAVDNDLKDFSLQDTKNVRILLSVPSIETRVCDIEVKEFNGRAAEIPGVQIVTVSMDLPFTQAKWCAANGIEQVKTVSDYKYRSFGEEYGTYIKELGLLTRAAFVVDSSNKVVYAEYVEEVSTNPDFDAVIKAAKEAK